MTALAEHLSGYLAIRRALGFQLINDERLLSDFTDYLDARGHTRVTVDAALAWAVAPVGASRGLTASRLSTVRRFASYLSAFEADTEVPPMGLLPGSTSRSAPHIFSLAEVQSLMGAARLMNPPLRGASIATLIGLMAATGLRTGEALRLNTADVDLDGGLLLVLVSKGGKTRQLPLDPTTVLALGSYASRRQQLCPTPASPSFLLSARGERITSGAASAAFRILLAELDIAAPVGRRRPRLYDLRHTFAVNTLLDWHATGVDVERRLPALSTYLGHVNPANTYWYLQAVPALMTVVADRLQAHQGPAT